MPAVREVAVNAPERSLQQRLDALEHANHVRSYRKALKMDMKRSRRSVGAVLADPEPEVGTMKVFDLLLAAPKYGRVKAHKRLTQARISPSKTVGGLTERQRAELRALLR